MSEELYLILHKVRGEPAFDIAQNIGDETGDLWIIPTSGHRAYPYWHEELSEVIAGNRLDIARNGNPPMPEDWPDHYDAKRDSTPMIDQLRSILKLNKPKKPTYRRY